ncbi:hypothetical protein JB92DRAFT_3107432 [Gautieria morchelliformis]|nr:hypothetical protein JB92DRAFT_3107432 [Gautieria morchelliformis]
MSETREIPIDEVDAELAQAEREAEEQMKALQEKRQLAQVRKEAAEKKWWEDTEKAEAEWKEREAQAEAARIAEEAQKAEEAWKAEEARKAKEAWEAEKRALKAKADEARKAMGLVFKRPVPPISCTTAERRIPTSLVCPVGPAVICPPNADKLEARFTLPHRTERLAFVWSKYDPLGVPVLARETEDPLQVAGQVFNITNREPVYFWDPLWLLILGLGAPKHNLEHGKWVLPQPMGYLFAWAAEWVYWVRGVDPTFTQEQVLGYKPDVGLAEGIQRSVEWWRSTQNSKESKQ